MVRNMITKWTVRWICRELRRDVGWWMAYQANIAMCMYDEVHHYFPLESDKRNFHDLCNKGAVRFLKMWTGAGEPKRIELNGAEAVFGFMGWLTSRQDVSGPFSAAHDASQAAELAEEFCKVNRLKIGEDGWYELLVHPKDPRGIFADSAHDMAKGGA